MTHVADGETVEDGIANRIRSLIADNMGARGKHRVLFELSGISENSWKNAWHGKQRYTSEMIEFVCRHWPAKATWLVLGSDHEPPHAHLVQGAIDSIVGGDVLECVEDLVSFRSSGNVMLNGPLHRISLALEGAMGVKSRSLVEAAAIDAVLKHVSRLLRK
jgi:hypothetical protein